MSADLADTQPATPETPAGPGWESVLTAIEAATAEAEAFVAPGFLFEASQAPVLALWTPPADLGPLPADLADRVLAILDRQADLAPQVEEAARAVRTHLRAVGSMRTSDTSAAVYLDAVG